MAENRRIWVFVITGYADAEFLLTSSISLPGPALEITEVAKTVLVDRSDAVLGSLILQGRLRLRWVYTAPPKERGGAHPILSITTETPYAVRVSASGATPELESIVQVAHVQDGQTEVLQRDRQGCITTVRDQSILLLTVRYGKHTETTLPAVESLAGERTQQPRPVISHFGTRRRS